MNMNRRTALKIGAAASMMPTSIFAETFSAIQILNNLEKSIFLSTNKNATKCLYIIAAPWCPFCKALYEAQVATNHDVDFRFVQMSFQQYGPAILNSFFSAEADKMGLFYKDPFAYNNAISSSAVSLYDNINRVTVHRMNKDLGQIVQGSGGTAAMGRWGYPTVVFENPTSQIQAVLGAWDFVSELQSLAMVDRAPSVDRYVSLLQQPPQTRTIRQNYFAKSNNTLLFSAPLEDAPVVDTLEERGGYPMVVTANVNGEDWFGANAFSSGDALMWGRSRDLRT